MNNTSVLDNLFAFEFMTSRVTKYFKMVMSDILPLNLADLYVI